MNEKEAAGYIADLTLKEKKQLNDFLKLFEHKNTTENNVRHVASVPVKEAIKQQSRKKAQT